MYKNYIDHTNAHKPIQSNGANQWTTTIGAGGNFRTKFLHFAIFAIFALNFRNFAIFAMFEKNSHFINFIDECIKTISITQTLVNQWQSNGVNSSQWATTISAGSKPLYNLSFSLNPLPASFWMIDKVCER
jgi:hypothetical protein